MPAFKDIIVSCLESETGIAAVVLFGSQVTSGTRKDSDVDIGVLFEYLKLPSSIKLIELRERVADLLNRSVDLVCLNTCSPIIGMQIFQHGDVPSYKNTTAYHKYLIKLFSEYHDLKYMRLPAENAILERKYYD